MRRRQPSPATTIRATSRPRPHSVPEKSSWPPLAMRPANNHQPSGRHVEKDGWLPTPKSNYARSISILTYYVRMCMLRRLALLSASLCSTLIREPYFFAFLARKPQPSIALLTILPCPAPPPFSVRRSPPERYYTVVIVSAFLLVRARPLVTRLVTRGDDAEPTHRRTHPSLFCRHVCAPIGRAPWQTNPGPTCQRITHTAPPSHWHI